MSNVTRVAIGDEVAEVIEAAGQSAAFEVLESAFDIQQREQRAMTLEEALRIVRGVSAQVEAIG